MAKKAEEKPRPPAIETLRSAHDRCPATEQLHKETKR